MARRRQIVKDLKGAKLLDTRPPFIPHAKNYRGSRRAGIIYEHAVAAHLLTLYGEDLVQHGPWFQYTDRRGDGWCSPDFIIDLGEGAPLVIADATLTVKAAKERKLRHIYLPVLAAVWPDRDIKLLQIAKNLRRDWDDVLVDSVEELIEAQGLDFATWILKNVKVH